MGASDLLQCGKIGRDTGQDKEQDRTQHSNKKESTSTQEWENSCRCWCFLVHIHNDSRSKVGCTVSSQAWGESQKCSLPLTVSVAEVFSCPHTHKYSPASATSRLQICSSHTAPSCFRVYLSPFLRVSVPFFHSTGASLVSSHRSVAMVPSVASLFLSFPMNWADETATDTNTETIVFLQHWAEAPIRP